MRGPGQQRNHIFSYTAGAQGSSVATDSRHVDEVLKELSPEFAKMYAKGGRPSIPPEQLLWALLLHTLYSVRSEQLLVEDRLQHFVSLVCGAMARPQWLNKITKPC